MKLGKSNLNKAGNKLNMTRPAINSAGKNSLIMLVLLITAALIGFVVFIGSKATSTVDVVMLNQAVHKNQQITEDMITEYKMIKAEYEKFSTISTQNNNKAKPRIITWSDRDKLINAYAAYPLQKDTLAMYSSFLSSRTDNKDRVLYSFPGKEIVTLDMGSNEMASFKNFLQPGDKINIQATYSEKSKDSDTEMFRTETVFNNIVLADMLNSSGESILDIYSDFNERSTYEQSQLENNDTWKQSVVPSTILVALTPEEKERYFYYTAKSKASFKVSLPQRED